MLRKNGGKINEIVYNNTAYYNGKYRYYPTITGLNGILEEIINSNSTTDYIRITPFYVNEQLERQIEFEEYMFYIECREWFDEEIQEMHVKECLNVEDTQRPLKDLELGGILYPLWGSDSFAGTTPYRLNYGIRKKLLSTDFVARRDSFESPVVGV